MDSLGRWVERTISADRAVVGEREDRARPGTAAAVGNAEGTEEEEDRVPAEELGAEVRRAAESVSAEEVETLGAEVGTVALQRTAVAVAVGRAEAVEVDTALPVGRVQQDTAEVL